jgi:hypothetical protein
MNPTLDFQSVQQRVAQAKREAYHATRELYKFVSGRDGALLCTGSATDQCQPAVAAESPVWDGTKRHIEMLVADVLNNYPDVTWIYIEGAYDGAESIRAWKDDEYDPRVEEWSVTIWTRADGYVVRDTVYGDGDAQPVESQNPFCTCGHRWERHTSHPSGSSPCKSFGCGCSDYEETK